MDPYNFYVKVPMVLPLTVKNVSRKVYGENEYGSKILIYSFNRSGFSQKKPYDVDTPCKVSAFRSVGFDAGPHAGNNIDGLIVEATNTARKRFVDKLGDSSSFGATLTAELRATWGTVVNGITDTLLAARAVKRGQLEEAAKILGFAPPTVRKEIVVKRSKRRGGKYKKKTVTREFWHMPSGRYVLKSMANKWLWFSYGIKPLVGDIYNGMDVLTRETPNFKCIDGNASASQKWAWRPSSDAFSTTVSSVRVKIKGHITVVNPNLWLANQLGLVNPVQMFNEGIPFSFVIDWFSNLSQVIMQMTDFVGLRIERPIYSVKSKSKHTYITTGGLNWWVSADLYDRTLEIPKAKLRFAYERFQWQRGANAISLLVGLLKAVRQ